MSAEHIQVGDGPCSGCGGPHKISDQVAIEVAALITAMAPEIWERWQKTKEGVAR